MYLFFGRSPAVAGSDGGIEREKRLLTWLVCMAERASDSDSLPVSRVLADEFDEGRDPRASGWAREALRVRRELMKSRKESWASRAFIESRDETAGPGGEQRLRV